MTIRSIVLSLVLIFTCSSSIYAHEIRPVFMSLTEGRNGMVMVNMRLPARRGMALNIQPLFPDGCSIHKGPVERIELSAVLRQWTLECENSFRGQEFSLPRLQATMLDAIIQVNYFEGGTASLRITATNPGFIIPERPSLTSIFYDYSALGWQHILSGADHLLFVIGLLFLVSGFRRLIITLTSFTLAHSFTLVVVSLNLITVQSAVVETLIALSLVFLGAEIIAKKNGKGSLISARPGMVAFVFGLIHGLGFAGALSEIGLQPTTLLFSLAAFNLGIEAGQLFIVLLVLILIKTSQLLSVQTPQILQHISAYIIGISGTYWCLDRASTLFI